MQNTQTRVFAADEDALEPLLLGVASRDTAAFAMLQKATAAKMFGIAYRILGNRADAEEVVGDVYTRVWYCQHPFNPAKGKALGWLASLCRHAAIDCMRRSGRRISHAAYELNSVGNMGESPERAVEKFEAAKLLAAAIGRLPHPQRHFLALSFREGLSHREISTRYEVPLGTVKSHLNRTLKRLRRELQPLKAEQRRPSAVL